MKPWPLPLTRRMFIGGAVAGLASPRLASARQTGTAMRLRCRFSEQDFTCRLLDNATSRDLCRCCPWI
jgi:hypothetical protein